MATEWRKPGLPDFLKIKSNHHWCRQKKKKTYGKYKEKQKALLKVWLISGNPGANGDVRLSYHYTHAKFEKILSIINMINYS